MIVRMQCDHLVTTIWQIMTKNMTILMGFNIGHNLVIFGQYSSVRGYSISKSSVSLLPSPCRAKALSAARRLDTKDL
jgi:hypothetical protein